MVGSNPLVSADEIAVKGTIEAYKFIYQKVIDAAQSQTLSIKFVDND